MSSTNAHKEQAKWVGDNFYTVFEEFTGWDEKFFESNEAEAYDVSSTMHTKVFNVLEQTNVLAEKAGFKTESFPASILDGNLKARLRMITLYDLARKTNGLVLSTDNLSEFQMGFWTICGDVGDYAPLQNIGKGFELPAIARQLDIRNDIIVQAPSDGLMITDDDTDEAQLGANYKEVDTIMFCYKNDNPYFIDFQGGRKGPYYYDVASFLWQASAKYSFKLRRKLVYEYYNSLKNYIEVPSERHFVDRLSLFVLFRTLQVLGAYGFRGYFERKKHFLDSIPPAMDNLRELLKLNPEIFPYPYMMEMLKKLTEMPQFSHKEEPAVSRADGYKITDSKVYVAHSQDGPATFSSYDGDRKSVV